jgi:hypothetical protein
MPEEFFDITSSMLLVQPEPQYLYALLYLSAIGASLPNPVAIGLPGRQVSGVGADYSSAERDRQILSNPLTTDVFAVKADFNAAPGSTLRINRPVFANTTYTEASRRIATGTSISTVPVSVSSEQTNLTLYRFGGPYDNANNRVAPYAISAFDANMGIHNAAKLFGTHLKRDCHKFVDSVVTTLLDLGSTTVFPEGMTAANDATATGSFPFTYEQLSRCEQEADQANLPTFPDGYRVAVLTPTQVKQLKDDPQYTRYAEKHEQYNALFPQYVRSVGKTHIFKSTTLTISNNASSVPIHYGHYIAPGALMGGMGRQLRVAPNTDDNYGEDVKVIWIGDLAFGVANNTLVKRLASAA